MRVPKYKVGDKVIVKKGQLRIENYASDTLLTIKKVEQFTENVYFFTDNGNGMYEKDLLPGSLKGRMEGLI